MRTNKNQTIADNKSDGENAKNNHSFPKKIEGMHAPTKEGWGGEGGGFTVSRPNTALCWSVPRRGKGHGVDTGEYIEYQHRSP